MDDTKDAGNKTHIDLIGKRLWETGQYSKAAVLVGSGFSRNAESFKENPNSFPVWKDIANAMFDELYPDWRTQQNRRNIKVQMTTGLGVLKLAEAYESRLGRGMLYNLIERVMPNKSFKPGRLHERLLELPWADVFTTNYDTLLEDTLPKILSRKYDVCLTSDHIALRQRPRIIKLHGTLPIYDSLIITEEHYRTYPRVFAPFVNSVQQSMMENTFCLIGFSADDPNFLSWTGWVRDNLGKCAPQSIFAEY